MNAVLRAYELGASDYINRPFDSRVVRRRVSNTIACTPNSAA